MNAISQAIKNLELSTKALDKFMNDPKHYNSIYSTYLETAVWEMHKQASDLRELQYQYGVE